MEIKCDNCSAVAETIMPETARDGDLEYTFFRCQSCGTVYPIAATDDALRKSRATTDIDFLAQRISNEVDDVSACYDADFPHPVLFDPTPFIPSPTPIGPFRAVEVADNRLGMQEHPS